MEEKLENNCAQDWVAKQVTHFPFYDYEEYDSLKPF